MINVFKNIGKFLFVATVFLGCNACGNVENDESDTVEVSPITWEECGYQMGDHMCDFSLKDQNGDEFSLYDHYGQPIILDYSTMWCGYCQIAAQEVTSVQSNYASHDLLYATVLIEDLTGSEVDVSDCENWSTVFGIIDQPVLAGSRDLIQSSTNEGVEIAGWPTFFFLTDELVIDTILRGYSSEAIDQGIQGIITNQE